MNLNESRKSSANSAAVITHRVLAFARSEMKAFLGCTLGCYLGFIIFFVLKADPETATFGDFLRVIQSPSTVIFSVIAGALSVALRGLFPTK
nr:hypothetical protein [uncultured Pseudomonas sp.]